MGPGPLTFSLVLVSTAIETMQIKELTESRMVLIGVPGRRIWMIVLAVLGLLLTAGCCFFAAITYDEYDGIAFPHLPLALGLLIAQGLFWTGAITLAVGKLTLILDTANGMGEYRVKSPIIDAGKSCVFKLEKVHGVTIETTTESRPNGPNHTSYCRDRAPCTPPLEQSPPLNHARRNRKQPARPLGKQCPRGRHIPEHDFGANRLELILVHFFHGNAFPWLGVRHGPPRKSRHKIPKIRALHRKGISR